MKRKNEIIIVLTNILVIVLALKSNIFGSTMDFLNQHIVFPEYLRQTFYETGKIIPSTITIGGIENIYNIAYYGLLNPVILFSYLFPFVRMLDYIVISNIVLLISSCLLFYKFMKSKFDDFISLITALLFSLSGPLIFQFHRHFMFVNYMPFLILSLICIDSKNKIGLIINVFLIIMMSFYYSIPSIIVIIIYYIYKNFDNMRKIPQLIIYLLVSILMSAILWLPTLFSILNSRVGTNSFDVFSLLIPSINLDNILYGAYSVGLTSVVVIAFIYLLQTKKKNNIFLVISIFLLSFVPIFLYLLNGGLYLRSKVLIPLLPIFVYIIGIFLNDLFENKIDIKRLLVLILIFNLIVLIWYHVLVYYLDLVFMVVLILLYFKTRNKNWILIPLLLLNLVICVVLNNTETYISNDLYNSLEQNINLDTTYRLSNLNDNNYTVNKYSFTPNIYSSTINRYYNNLYHNIFKVNRDTINNLELTSTSNPLFNEYLGVKYLVSDKDLGFPYEYAGDNIYVLNQSLTIGYVNSNTVNKAYYESLQYPYNLDILLNSVITSDSPNEPVSGVEEVNLDYDYQLGENIVLRDNKLYVEADDKIVLNINDNMNNKILFIDIYNQVEQDIDIKMSINGQVNLLTKKSWLYPNNNNVFHFCVSGNRLDISLSKGIYDVSDIRTYILDNDYINGINSKIDMFNITKMSSEQIYGTINVTHSGYFVLSIPYDEGFKIKVNGNDRKYELINDAFIGFYLEKGNYDINITYEPPLLKYVKVVSVFGFVFLIVLTIRERKKK